MGFSESTEFIRATEGALLDWFRNRGDHSRLDGGSGNNLLAGGLGVDTFVFAATEVSDNRVIGFEDWDRVELRHFGYADVDEALARFSQEARMSCSLTAACVSCSKTPPSVSSMQPLC